MTTYIQSIFLCFCVFISTSLFGNTGEFALADPTPEGGDGSNPLHEEVAKQMHEADTVMSKYYYSTLQRRENAFVCAETGEQLHASRVDDGICDCCDGSDEPQKTLPCKTTTPCLKLEGKLARLKQWLKENGAEVDSVEGSLISINSIGGKANGTKTSHGGVRILKNGLRGDKILSIPLNLVFTGKAAEESGTEQGRLIAILKPHLDQMSFLAVSLLNEMNIGVKSKFYPWIATLPMFVKNIVHTRAVSQFLSGQTPASSLLIDMTNNEVELLFSAYKIIRVHLLDSHPEVFAKSEYSIGRFLHAYSIVNSRSFSLKLSREETAAEEVVVVPLADFLNHHHEAVSSDEHGNSINQIYVEHNDAKGKPVGYPKVNVYLGQDYAEGNEVFLSYGSESSPVPGHITDGGSGSNAYSIHHFGFISPENPGETVRISLEYMLRFDQSSCGGVTQTGNIENWRKTALLMNDVSHVHYISLSLDGKLSASDRTALRVWTLCTEQAVHLGTENLNKLTKAGKVLAEANEVAVDWMVIFCLEQILADHKTGAAEDVRMLEHVNPMTQPDFYNAILYVATVKRIAMSGLLSALNNLYGTYRRAAANWMDTDEAKVALKDHAGNVDNYTKWVEDLKVWRDKYLEWKKNV